MAEAISIPQRLIGLVTPDQPAAEKIDIFAPGNEYHTPDDHAYKILGSIRNDNASNPDFAILLFVQGGKQAEIDYQANLSFGSSHPEKVFRLINGRPDKEYVLTGPTMDEIKAKMSEFNNTFSPEKKLELAIKALQNK